MFVFVHYVTGILKSLNNVRFFQLWVGLKHLAHRVSSGHHTQDILYHDPSVGDTGLTTADFRVHTNAFEHTYLFEKRFVLILPSPMRAWRSMWPVHTWPQATRLFFGEPLIDERLDLFMGYAFSRFQR